MTSLIQLIGPVLQTRFEDDYDLFSNLYSIVRIHKASLLVWKLGYCHVLWHFYFQAIFVIVKKTFETVKLESGGVLINLNHIASDVDV